MWNSIASVPNHCLFFYFKILAQTLAILSLFQRSVSFMERKFANKKISNDLELIQSDPTSCPQNQKGNN